MKKTAADQHKKPVENATDGNPSHIDTQTLFGKAKELIILHNDEEYCLRITRNNKLILTK